MQQSNESCCNAALVKFLAEFLRTTPTAARDDCVFPLDTFSLYKHYFVLTQHELGEGCNAYLKKKRKEAAHPLRRLYGVTSRDGRKDCNNRDSLAHRMRGPIKAGGEETLGPISVRERPPPLSICCSGERQQAVYLFSPSFSTNRPMDRPDKILLSHPSTPVFLVLSSRYLDWQE